MLVDSAALSEALNDYWRSNEFQPGAAVLSLEFDSAGINIRRDVIETTLRPAVVDSVRALVFDAMRMVDATEQEWGVRLGMQIDPESVGFRVGPQEYCPPRPRDPDLDSAMSGIVATGPRYRRGRRERTVILRALIHPNGYVMEAEVVQGAASGSTLERNLGDLVRRYSFYPATRDGRPVAGYIDVPIRISG